MFALQSATPAQRTAFRTVKADIFSQSCTVMARAQASAAYSSPVDLPRLEIVVQKQALVGSWFGAAHQHFDQKIKTNKKGRRFTPGPAFANSYRF